MPPPKYLDTDYFGAMDRPSYFKTLDEQVPVYHQTPANADQGVNSGLTPHELGTTLNPMEHQLKALQAKIKEGASKVEFEFLGRGKGNSQQATPESYGKEEREMMRQLAQINKIKSSTHATPSVSGLAGFGENGFDKRQQHQTIKEVQRAIDFAKDATTGGAVVVHTGEWQRPVSPYYGKQGREEQMGFSSYEGEDEKAQMFVIDGETGRLISEISKDRTVAVPKWMTAKDLGEEFGKDYTGEGKYIDGRPAHIAPDDYVDMYGKKIDMDEPEQLFRRVPKYVDEGGDVRFEVEELDWSDLRKRKDEFNKKYNKDLTTEKFFAQQQIDNQILQAKGGSLFHLQRYKQQKDRFEKLKQAYEYYQELDDNLPEEEKWRLTRQVGGGLDGILPSENKQIPELLKDEMEQTELSMRHTHQSSSASDVQAKEYARRREQLKTLEEYGLEQTGQALARLADEAMTKSEQARKMRNPDEDWEDLYIAPENWNPQEYGSHPQELLRIVQAGREEFKKKLENKHKIYDKKKQDELAKKHIKTTFDIGHLNMWRSMLERKEEESEEEFQNRFNNWVKGHLEELHQEEAIGHLHLTDNFGYDDEHLSLGQGNAPVKEFVKWMQERGYDDFIIEPGSFNPTTIMPDGWSYLGAAPQRRFGPEGGWRSQRMAHAGLYQNPNYIVGSYVPSNEWTLWTGVPLE